MAGRLATDAQHRSSQSARAGLQLALQRLQVLLMPLAEGCSKATEARRCVAM